MGQRLEVKPEAISDDFRLAISGISNGQFLSRSRYIGVMPKTSASSAKVLSSKPVYRGPVFWVTTDQVIEPGGVRARRDIVRHSGSVVVLAVDENGGEPRILLERQYRHAAQSFLWELPAGRIDEGESELEGAKRELLEETGYTASQWQRLFRYYASPGFIDETMAIYMARGLKAGKAQPEEDERIRKRFVPLATAFAWINKGIIRDGKTIAGVLWLKTVGNVKRARK